MRRRGPDWTPITPSAGSFFHADPHSERAELIWSEHRWLIIAVLVAVAALGVWWLWVYVAAAAGWLGEYSEEIRNLMLAVGVGAAIFGGWVAYRRSQTDRMRAETDRLRQVTESFAKAIELLGHADRSVRLGAIYALERIARQNRDEHWPIMETLTAYVRDWSERKWAEVGADEEDSISRGLGGLVHLEPAPTDIQAVFTVLGRRRLDHEEGVGLEARRLNLARAYLVEVNPDPAPQREFGRAILRRANLSGWATDLNEANLQGADLGGADLKRAKLAGANLTGAQLTHADLRETTLSGANLKRAYLYWADLRGAYLEGANLEEANLGWGASTFAEFEQANLAGAQLQGANLRQTNIKRIDLSTAIGLTQEQLNSAIGDKDTKIPEGLTRPEHWLE